MIQSYPIDEPGMLFFVPYTALPTPPGPPGPTDGTAPLPVDSMHQGWPSWIAGVHTDGAKNWYLLERDADPAANQAARYKRLYDPGPPTPPPAKPNVDGVSLWYPMANQQQGTCRFEPGPYD